jgi:REP element-mobilizing transposase RayT
VFPGAVYHVIARGNNKQRIFHGPGDWNAFLELVETAVERYAWIVYGYCLMHNHYHLLIETPRGNLSIGMRHLNGRYASGYNRRRDHVGHVFQGRFAAILVEKDSHLLETVRYIALNPVRTREPLCERPEEWPWSSYAATLGLAPSPPWLASDWVLAQFAEDRATARARLKAFVDEGLLASAEPESWPAGIYSASEQYVRARTADLQPIAEIPRAHWQPLRPTLGEIFADAGDAIGTAYRDYGYTMREIAEHLGCHYTTISRRLQRSGRGGDPGLGAASAESA